MSGFAGKPAPRDYLEEQHADATGQAPAAVILGCIDSRVPAEIVFDAGIGELFVARVAGNVVDEDILGSLEYACAEAGRRRSSFSGTLTVAPSRAPSRI